MSKSWMSTVAGILDIVSGALGLWMGALMTLARHAARTAAGAATTTIPNAHRFATHLPVPALPSTLTVFHPWIGIALIVVSILAIVGGIFALKVKNWGMALAGSIAAVFSGRLLGLIALVFTVLAKHEYSSPQTTISTGT